MTSAAWQRYWVQRWGRRSAQGGFTLIELLVVVVITGVLVAIALPSFLDQSVRARQAEAKTTLNAWTKAQQLYRHEYGRFFSFHDLALGLPTDSKNYNYLGGGGEEEFADDFARLMAYSKNDSLKRYAAGVERDTVAVNLPDGRREYQVHNLPVLCESHAPGRGLAERPVVNDARDGAWPTCPAGYVNIFRP